MAITQVSAPTSPCIASRPVLFTFTSDTSDIVYLEVRVKLDGAAVATLSVDQNLNDEFEVDISRLIRDRFIEKARLGNYIMPAIADGSIAVVDDMRVSCVLEVFEVSDVAPYVTNYPDGAADFTTTAIYALNAARQNDEQQSLSGYIAGSAASKFLTKAPLSKFIRDGESEMLYIYISDTDKAAKLSVICYDDSGVESSNTFATSGLTENNIIKIPAGVANIETMNGSALITADTISYTITLTDALDAATSETRTFVIDRSTANTTRRMLWVNTLGAIDFYTFNKNYSEKKSTEHITYNSYLPFSFDQYDKSVHTLATTVEKEYTIESDSLNDTLSEWLNEMQHGFNWYIEIDAKYIPVQLKSGERVVKSEADIPVAKVQYALANQPVTLR